MKSYIKKKNIQIYCQKRFEEVEQGYVEGFFGGEGFIMQKFEGNGMVFLEIDGSVMQYELAAGQSLVVDTGNLAVMESTVSVDVQGVKGIGNALLGGEGFFNTRVTGPGRVWLQTMPIMTLASNLSRYMVTSK